MRNYVRFMREISCGNSVTLLSVSALMCLVYLVPAAHLFLVFDFAAPTQSTPTLFSLTILLVGFAFASGYALSILRRRILINSSANYDESYSRSLATYGAGDRYDIFLKIGQVRHFIQSKTHVAIYDMLFVPVFLVVLLMMSTVLFVWGVLLVSCLYGLDVLNKTLTEDLEGAANSEVLKSKKTIRKYLSREVVDQKTSELWSAHRGVTMDKVTLAHKAGCWIDELSSTITMCYAPVTLCIAAYLSFYGIIPEAAVVVPSILMARVIGPVTASIAGRKDFLDTQECIADLIPLNKKCTPPKRCNRLYKTALAATVAFFFVFLPLGAWFVEIPKRVSAHAEVSAEGKPRAFHVKYEGHVIRSLKENDTVMLGDVVYELDTEMARAVLAQMTARKDQLLKTKAEIEQTSKSIAAVYDDMAGGLSQKSDIIAVEMRRNDRIVSKGYRAKATQDRMNVMAIDHGIQTLASKSNLLQQKHESIQAIASIDAQIADAERQIRLAKDQIKYAAVRSPATGVIGQLAFTVNSRANPSQQAGYIITDADTMQMEAKLRADRRHYVYKNQRATIQIRGIEHTKYASFKFTGAVTAISPTSFEPVTSQEQVLGSYYKVKIELSDQSARVVREIGGAVGMVGVAHFDRGKTNLLSQLTSPFYRFFGGAITEG